MSDAKTLAEQYVKRYFCEDNEILWERGGQYTAEVYALRDIIAQAQRDARKELLIEISQRYAAGSTGFDILTWCYSELDTVVAQMKAKAQEAKP